MSDEITFAAGDRVEKYTGDYRLTGEVVAVARKRSGEVRYLVEADAPAGLLMVYAAKQLRHYEDHP